MGIREWINQHRSVGVVAAAVVIVGAGAAIYVQARSLTTAGPGKGYFTIDDGKTVFLDDVVKFAPFDKDGKPAYKAHVFECGGKRVVGYMSRYTDSALAALKEAKSYAGTGKMPPNVGALATIGTTGQQVKRPGSDKWVSAGDINRATLVRSFRCPDGSTPSEVDP